MSELHRKMSLEEFENFPHRLGWKHEYCGDALHLSPSHTAIANLRLELGPVALATTSRVRALAPEDEPALAELFQEAFRGAAEYAGWPKRFFVKEARRNVANYFLPEGKVRPEASGVIEEAGRPIAAIVVKQRSPGPILEPIFVAPDRQLQGLGASLLLWAIQGLLAAGEQRLFSRCHLGNPHSMAWHLKNGFVELPNLFVAQHRHMHFALEAERWKRLGDRKQAKEMARLSAQWRAEVKRLDQIHRSDLRVAYGFWDH